MDFYMPRPNGLWLNKNSGVKANLSRVVLEIEVARTLEKRELNLCQKQVLE